MGRARRQSFRRRGVLAAVTAAAVTAGSLTAVSTAVAEPVTAVVPQTCGYPLIGSQHIEVRAGVDLPASQPVGTSTPATDAAITVTLPEEINRLYELIGATTLTGTATVPISTTFSDGRSSTREHTFHLDGPAVPADGPTTITGTAPIAPVTSATPDTATWSIGPVRLTMLPLRADGSETGVGTFDAACATAPGTDTTLARTTFGGGPAPVGATVEQSCPVALIGSQSATVRVGTTLPATLPPGVNTQQSDVFVSVTFSDTFADGMRLVGAKSLRGELRLPVIRSFEGSPVQTTTGRIEFTGVPIRADRGETVLSGKFTFAPFTSTTPGTARLDLGALAFTMTPLTLDGSETGLGTFDAACGIPSGEDTAFASVAFTGDQPGPGGLRQSCPIPLIGTQVLGQRTSVRLPESLPVGGTTPATDLTVAVTFPAEYVHLMGLVGAQYLRGTLTVPVSGSVDGADGVTDRYTVAIPDVPIPAAGELTVTGSAAFRQTTSQTAGTLVHRIGDLALDLTPLTASGAETGLGQFLSDCALAPGQDDTLASVRFVAGAPQACPFPLIGNQPVDLRTTVDLPARLTTGETTPARDLTANTTFSATIAQGLALFGATRLRGEVRLPVTRSFNGTAVSTVTYRMPLDVRLPDPPAPFSIAPTAALDRITSQVPGTSEWSTGALSFTLTPLTEEGHETGLEFFDVTCSVPPGQDTRFAAVEYVAAPDRPNPPTDVAAHDITSTSVRLTWAPATGPNRITGYDVYNGNALVTTQPGTETTISGLAPDTAYSYTVVARDETGASSAPSAAVAVRTLPTEAESTPFAHSFSGSTQFAASKAKAVLNGSTTGTLVPSSGEVTADTAFDPTAVSLRYLGLIPATAVVNLVPTGKTTGSLTGGVLSTSTVVRVKVPVVLVFGMPVHQSTACGASAPSTLDLKSGPGFTPAAGGTVRGTYSVPTIAGCGSYGTWLSSALSGPGNTIQLALAPRA